jgi:hypothetical protein
MKKILLLLLLITQFRLSYAQSNRFANNIVKISSIEYGFIIGQSGGWYYLITVRPKQTGLLDNVIVHLNATKQKGRPGVKIDEFEMAEYLIGLYRISNVALPTEMSSFLDIKSSQGSFNTFMDWEASSDGLIVQADKYTVIPVKESQNQPIIRFGIESKGVFFRGMPVIDGHENLVAIVLDDNQLGTSRSFNALSISTLRNKIAAIENRHANPCQYFTILERGESLTSCAEEDYKNELKRDSIDRERRAKELLNKQQRKDYKLSKANSWSWGPAVCGQMDLATLASNSNGLGSDPYSVFKISAGLNLYLAPDAKILRITLKPRYNYVKIENPNLSYGLSTFELESFDYTLLESPIQLEFGVDRKADVTYYFGVSYSPGLQTDYRLNYSDQVGSYNSKADSTGGFVQSVGAELGFEYKRFRFSLNFSQQLGAFKGKEYSMMTNSGKQMPFNSFKRMPTLFGFDLSWRLKGVWGIKHKQAPSRFLSN